MGCPRPRTVSLNTESGDNRQMQLEITGIKIACWRKEKREIQKLLLFLTQVADPHHYALMLVSYPEVFVSLATTDPSHKALLEWFVTRHANKPCRDQEPPKAIRCPVKKLCQFFCALILVLHPGIFRVFYVWYFLKQQKQNTNYSTELNNSAQRTIFIV